MPADRNIINISGLFANEIYLGTDERGYILSTVIDDELRAVEGYDYAGLITGPPPYSFDVNTGFPFHNNITIAPDLSKLPEEIKVNIDKIWFVEQVSPGEALIQFDNLTAAQVINNIYTSQRKEIKIPAGYKDKILELKTNILEYSYYKSLKGLGAEIIANTVPKLNLEEIAKVELPVGYKAVVSLFGDVEKFKRPQFLSAVGERGNNLSSTTNLPVNARDKDYNTSVALSSIPDTITTTETGAKYYIWIGVSSCASRTCLFNYEFGSEYMLEYTNKDIVLPGAPGYVTIRATTSNSIGKGGNNSGSVYEILLFRYERTNYDKNIFISNIAKSVKSLTGGSSCYIDDSGIHIRGGPGGDTVIVELNRDYVVPGIFLFKILTSDSGRARIYLSRDGLYPYKQVSYMEATTPSPYIHGFPNYDEKGVPSKYLYISFSGWYNNIDIIDFLF